MALTEAILKKLQPKIKTYLVSDDGLTIQITPTGNKSWYFRYRWQGKQTKLYLGKYPFTSLKQAREKCSEMHYLLYQGTDPQTHKNQYATGGHITLQAFIPEWKDIKYKRLGLTDPNRRNSTQTQIERYLKKDILPALGHIPLQSITPQNILKVLRSMEHRGAFTPAEKVRCWIKEIFKHAMALRYVQSNPTDNLDMLALPKPLKHHNPYLTMKELPSFLNALSQYAGERQTRLGFKLLLLTGVRPGELRFARPEQFDLEKALWTIPVKEVKQYQQQIKKGKKIPDYLVPLSKQAVEVVQELLGMSYANQKYLLLGRSNHQKPVSENTFNLVIKRIDYAKRLTSHGIRGTLSTALHEMSQELGLEKEWIEAQLSHVDPNKTRRAYNHAQYITQRSKMMQLWADKLDEWQKQAV